MSIFKTILSGSQSFHTIGGVDEVTVHRDFAGGAAEMVVRLDHRLTVDDALVMCICHAPRRPVMVSAMLHHVDESSELLLCNGFLPGCDFRL